MTETFWSLICKWMKRVESYGYTNTWSIINAKHQGVPQNRERFFLLSQREDVAIDYSWPKSKPLTTRLEDVLEEEVADRYFLKDDAVSKFLKANDSDNALFLQFDLPPTHEAAMFLKTLLQVWMEKLDDGWSKGIEWNEKELNYQRLASVTFSHFYDSHFEKFLVALAKPFLILKCKGLVYHSFGYVHIINVCRRIITLNGKNVNVVHYV